MKRNLFLKKLVFALLAMSILFSLDSCSSKQNYLSKGRSSSYSKVRTRQPSWNSTTSLNVRYKMKKKKSKSTAVKKKKNIFQAKSREYNPNPKD
ncbi:MAG TPA: hypothetical protein PKG88_08185 [Bacteroidales bacterium]|nr:hypothetical protein [Bacteroidales bacterium]HPS72602.1 hypothetical protein [Bacteroidales bacterium]